MEIHQLKDKLYTSNVYLIDGEKPTLIDTGGSLKDKIIEWVPKVLGDRALSQIVFTHGHPDHVQGADELAAHFKVPLFIDPADGEHVGNYQALPNQLHCGNAIFEIIRTPGHSPGGVCLYESSQKILISGDTIFPGGRTGRWDLPGSNYDALINSVKTLMKLEIDALYPGHYDPINKNIAANLEASLGTLVAAGEGFDEDIYDSRIQELKEQLST